MTSPETRLLAAAAPAPLRWEGAPNVFPTLLAELGLIGLPLLALSVLGVIVGVTELAARSVAPVPEAHDPAIATAALAGGLALALAVVPGALLEWLNLRHTRYAVGQDQVVVVDGLLGRRARRFRLPKDRPLAVLPNKAGSIELGWVELEELDSALKLVRKESLPIRLRGLGDRAPQVLAALEAARA